MSRQQLRGLGGLKKHGLCARGVAACCRLLTWNTAPRGVAAALPTPTPASMAWLDSMPRT
jgi:hypothetical protein